MKNYRLTIILGSCCLLTLNAFAGGVDILPISVPLQIDVPEMRSGWGFNIEVSGLRPYNNNLSYTLDSVEDQYVDNNNNTFTKIIATIPSIDLDYSLGLKIGIYYALGETANLLKFNYEHFFDKNATSNLTDISSLTFSSAAVREKFDGLSLVSEQHILIGPYWETTLTGGVRFAHLLQQLDVNSYNFALDIPSNNNNFRIFSAQFNGTGPELGFGTIFLLTNKFEVGAEALSALLIGKNNISGVFSSYSINAQESPIGYDITRANQQIEDIYSIVPEVFYRLYANYFHRFVSGTELQIEAGWRVNQFFNVRTFDTSAVRGNVNLALLARPSPPYTAEDVIFNNATTSDKISFAGPYLMFNYKL